jgi:hypothetical protein
MGLCVKGRGGATKVNPAILLDGLLTQLLFTSGVLLERPSNQQLAEVNRPRKQTKGKYDFNISYRSAQKFKTIIVQFMLKFCLF